MASRRRSSPSSRRRSPGDSGSEEVETSGLSDSFGMEGVHPDDRPSTKVHSVVHDVLAIEERSNWLESRNEWLTSKLLASKRSFVDRCFSGRSSNVVKRAFEAWQNGLSHFHMENQLEMVGGSLQKCHGIIETLGQAIEKERAALAEAETMTSQARTEYEQVASEQEALQRQVRADDERAAMIERKIREAEVAIGRVKADAEAVVEAGRRYDATRRDLQQQAEAEASPQGRRGSKQGRARRSPNSEEMPPRYTSYSYARGGAEMGQEMVSDAAAKRRQPAATGAPPDAPSRDLMSVESPAVPGGGQLTFAPPPPAQAAPMGGSLTISGASLRDRSAEPRAMAPPAEVGQVMLPRSQSEFNLRQPPGMVPMMRPPLPRPQAAPAGQMPMLAPGPGSFVMGAPTFARLPGGLPAPLTPPGPSYSAGPPGG